MRSECEYDAKTSCSVGDRDRAEDDSQAGHTGELAADHMHSVVDDLIEAPRTRPKLACVSQRKKQYSWTVAKDACEAACSDVLAGTCSLKVASVMVEVGDRTDLKTEHGLRKAISACLIFRQIDEILNCGSSYER